MFHVKHSSLALYVHWPFCRAKCPYCDFNSHVAESIQHESWRDAYLTELAHFSEKLKGRKLVSIFFGGGTPSLMQPETVAAVIEAAGKHFPFEPDIEITLEANPTSAEAQKFKAFKAAGVNRLSMGIQALNDADLKFLGREHSSAEALKALEMAGSVWSNFSFDLIYARPHQTVPAWEAELKKALAFGTPHLSLYQLTIEKGTPFYAAYQQKKFELPDDETAAALYEKTTEMAAQAGLFDYEVSNYAKPNFESRHNLAYWQYGEYLGIGPGAHSRLKSASGRRAVMMRHSPQAWLDEVAQSGCGIQSDEVVQGEELFSEALMMGLRLKEGMNEKELLTLAGASAAAFKVKIEDYIKLGMLERQAENIRTTTRGRLVLNSLLAKLTEG